jgi:hypothetical protein
MGDSGAAKPVRSVSRARMTTEGWCSAVNAWMGYCRAKKGIYTTYTLPTEMLDQVRALSEVYLANAKLLRIGEFDEYYEHVRMYTDQRFPGRMLVDLDLPFEPRIRGCFCVNPVTKKLEKLLDRPLVHFV